jgi:hypothetical protein
VTKVLWSSFQQLFDEYGDVLNGGKIQTDAGGTTTPKATYTDSTGNVANANPIVLSASGRKTGGIWVNKGEAYKFTLLASDDTELDVIDNAVVGEVATTDTQRLLISMTYCGTPGAQGFMGGAEILNTATIAVDFDGHRAVSRPTRQPITSSQSRRTGPKSARLQSTRPACSHSRPRAGQPSPWPSAIRLRSSAPIPSERRPTSPSLSRQTSHDDPDRRRRNGIVHPIR